jgi:cell division protein FtsL
MIAREKKIKKSNRPQIPYQKIFLKIGLGLLIILGITALTISNLRLKEKRLSLETRIDTLKRETEALEKKNADLQAQISQSSDESFLEKEARERFNLKKPGEQVVTVLPPENFEEKKIEESSKNLWQQFLEKFGL